MIRNFLKRKDPFEFDANLKKKFLEILIKLTKIHQKKKVNPNCNELSHAI